MKFETFAPRRRSVTVAEGQVKQNSPKNSTRNIRKLSKMQKLIPEQENGNKNLEKFDVEH